MDQRIRVLIADDRSIPRKGLRALLSTRPEIEVVGEATDGRKALHQVRKLRPDVVLMDVAMPVMDGLEATRVIRDRWPDTKVIILTIYALRRQDALAAGASTFLVKGCPAEELLDAIMQEDLPRSSSHKSGLPSKASREGEAPGPKLALAPGTV